MFRVKFKKENPIVRIVRLMTPFDSKEVEEFIKREFAGDCARMRWSNLLLIFGYGILFSLTANTLYFWNAENFWKNWLMFFSAGLLIILASQIRKIKEKERKLFEARVIFVLCLFGFVIWVSDVILNGLTNIWPELIAVELAIFGIGFFVSKKNFLLYGLILTILSFIISAGYLLK